MLPPRIDKDYSERYSWGILSDASVLALLEAHFLVCPLCAERTEEAILAGIIKRFAIWNW
jgi:hypothetical protein